MIERRTADSGRPVDLSAIAGAAAPATVPRPAAVRRPPHRLPPAAASLRHADFRRYWLGACIGLTGYVMQQTARAWLTLELTNSPFLVGLVMTASSLPMLVFGMVGGILADRWDPRRQIIACEATYGFAGAALALLVATGHIAVWQILALSAVCGSAFAIELPARQTVIVPLVPRENLNNAVSLTGSVMALAQVLGPAIGGSLIGIVGLAPTFLITSLLILPALILYTRARAHPPAVSRSGESILRNLSEGFAFVRHSQPVGRLVSMCAIAAVFGTSFSAFTPVIARDHLGTGSAGLGLLQALAGVGALTGALVVAGRRESARWFPLLLAMSAGYGTAIVLFALSPWFALSLPLSAATGFLMQGFFVSNMTLLLIITPDALRGRVVSMRLLVMGASPVGQFLIGAAAERVGTPLAVATSGALCAVLLTAFLITAPSLRKL
jgi:MFS family permease